MLANPPFGMSKWGADVFESDQYGRNIWGCPTDANADFAWLQHMIKSMDENNGRCAVVLPQGALFHGGKEGSIREEIIKADLLEAVITLAGGVFYSTGVSACVMFLSNKKEHKHKGRICLIDGSEVYTPMRAQNILSDENVDTLYSLYTNYEDVVERCKVVTLADVEKGGYDLNVKRYIEKKPQEVVPPEVVRRKYFEALGKVRTAEDKMQRLLLATLKTAPPAPKTALGHPWPSEGGHVSGK